MKAVPTRQGSEDEKESKLLWLVGCCTWNAGVAEEGRRKEVAILAQAKMAVKLG